MDTIQKFVEDARAKGMNDEQAKELLMSNGWSEVQAQAALSGLEVPKPPAHNSQVKPSSTPVAVVQNLTTRGFEYKIMSVAISFSLASLLWVAEASIGGGNSWSTVAFPLTVMLVCLPIAGVLFSRLRRSELSNPELRSDPSRRKSIQFMELLTFLAIVIHTIVFFYLVISGHYIHTTVYVNNYSYVQNSSYNFADDLLRWLITLVVAGSTFLFYWRDEHRAV